MFWMLKWRDELSCQPITTLSWIRWRGNMSDRPKCVVRVYLERLTKELTKKIFSSYLSSCDRAAEAGNFESEWTAFHTLIIETTALNCGKVAGASCGGHPWTQWWTDKEFYWALLVGRTPEAADLGTGRSWVLAGPGYRQVKWAATLPGCRWGNVLKVGGV